MFPPAPEALMPLTLRERKAIWHARQHYLKEFLFLLGPSPDEVETPAAFLSAFRYAISSINERITAEDPLTFDQPPATQETSCPPSQSQLQSNLSSNDQSQNQIPAVGFGRDQLLQMGTAE